VAGPWEALAGSQLHFNLSHTRGLLGGRPLPGSLYKLVLFTCL